MWGTAVDESLHKHNTLLTINFTVIEGFPRSAIDTRCSIEDCEGVNRVNPDSVAKKVTYLDCCCCGALPL
jgi:hypothetical protein